MPSERDGPLTRRRVLAGAAGVLALATTGGPSVPSFGGDRDDERPMVVGHRGAAAEEPPNTLAGIRRALEYDVDGVEIDVRRTADGELVLFHDPILDWSTDGSGLVHETRWDRIRDLRIGGEPIPTLAEGLAVLADADVEVYLEIKRVGYTEATLEAVREHGLLDRLTVASLKPDALAPARGWDVPTGLVGAVPTPDLLEEATRVDASLVSTHYVPYATPWFVDEARARGLSAGVWKLDETEPTLRAALEADPDTVTTNDPELALQLLEQ